MSETDGNISVQLEGSVDERPVEVKETIEGDLHADESAASEPQPDESSQFSHASPIHDKEEEAKEVEEAEDEIALPSRRRRDSDDNEEDFHDADGGDNGAY